MIKKILTLFIAMGMGQAYAAQDQASQRNTDPVTAEKTANSEMNATAADVPVSTVTPDVSLSDAQVSRVLTTINEGEVEASQIAKRKAQHPAVKEFAKMMADEHNRNKGETAQVSKGLRMKRDSDLAASLKSESKEASARLKNTDKAAFDKAYIDHMVMAHEKALSTITDTLMPNAKNQSLRAHLEKTHAAVSEHLNQAKDIQSQLQ